MAAALTARPPSDAQHFAAYIRTTTANNTYAAKKTYGSALWAVADCFLAKQNLMACALASIPGSPCELLHTLVWLQAEVLRQDYRNVSQLDMKRSHPLVDRAIAELMKRKPRRPASCIDDAESWVHLRGHNFADYYDCAAARRLLWKAWQEPCSPATRSGELYIEDADGETVGPCFHGHNEKTMALLNQHAYTEIRTNVWLMVRHALPPELAERVFEFALAGEDVPAVSEVRDGKAFREEYSCATSAALLSLGWK